VKKQKTQTKQTKITKKKAWSPQEAKLPGLEVWIVLPEPMKEERGEGEVTKNKKKETNRNKIKR